MTTRADYYVGRGPDAEWLGSTATDGYPSGMAINTSQDFDEAIRDIQVAHDVIEEHQKELFQPFLSVAMMTVPLESALEKLRQFEPPKTTTTYPVLTAKTEEEYRAAIAEHIATRKDFTSPERGWPWPWDDSATTDYAYAFDDGKVWASGFGRPWFDPMESMENGGYEPPTPGSNEDDEWLEMNIATEVPKITVGPVPVFPDMSSRKNVARGDRSGVISIGVDEQGRVSVE